MYSLTFVHPAGRSVVTWELDVPYEEVIFLIHEGTMATGFELKANSELLTIVHGAACLLELRFLEERMIYLLRLFKGGKIIREFYLEEDALAEEAQYTVQYP